MAIYDNNSIHIEWNSINYTGWNFKPCHKFMESNIKWILSIFSNRYKLNYLCTTDTVWNFHSGQFFITIYPVVNLCDSIKKSISEKIQLDIIDDTAIEGNFNHVSSLTRCIWIGLHKNSNNDSEWNLNPYQFFMSIYLFGNLSQITIKWI